MQPERARRGWAWRTPPSTHIGDFQSFIGTFRTVLAEIAAHVRAPAVVRVAELAHDLAALVEVERVGAVPARAPPEHRLEQPPLDGRLHRREVVLAHPADRRLAGGLVDHL